MSSEATARGHFAGSPWGATESDSSATGATSESELASSESALSQEYAAMDEGYWTQQGFSSSGEIPLGS